MKRSQESENRDHPGREKQRRVGDNSVHADIVCKQLHVQPRSRFSGTFPFFREPREIGAFSQDGQRKFHHNSNQLRYYAPPSNPQDVSFNLRAGYSVARLRDDSVKDLLDDLLRWILLNKYKFRLSAMKSNAENSGLNTDFICWRGLLTKVLCTPYENREGWIIAVIRHKDTFYMCEYDTVQRQEQKGKQTEKEKEMTYWGYKFEQYVTSDTKGGQPDTSMPVNNFEGYGSVVRTRLKNHSLVYGGEVDCCDISDTGRTYIELKTSRELYQPNNLRNFKRFKLIKWWAQSFLLGIPKIIAGFRDDNGVVFRLETFKTIDIPRFVKDIRDPWEADVCFNFLNHFLDFVKHSISENDYRIPYVFRWNPGEPISKEKYPAASTFSFLPQWYIDELESDSGFNPI